MSFPTFKLEFTDGTNFEGNSLTSDWLRAPERPIQALYFSFAGVSIRFENYQEYNHLIEKCAIVGSKDLKITKILLMARLSNITEVVEYNLMTKRAVKRTVAVGQEYNGQILTGWLKGEPQGNAKYSYGKF